MKRLWQLKVTHARPRIPCKNNKINQIEEKFGFCSQCFARKFGATPLLCTLRTCTILHNPAQCRETAKPETKENKGLSAGVLSAALCTLPIAFTPLPNRTAPIWYDQSRG